MKREFTIDAKIEIGKYTFDKLIETGYDPKVKEEVAKEYGITVGTVYKYLREYSYWYKMLNRNPESIKDLEIEMKNKYKLTTEDKLEKINNSMSLIRSFMDVLK